MNCIPGNGDYMVCEFISIKLPPLKKKKKNQMGGITVLNFKYHVVAVIRMVGLWQSGWQNKTEDPEIYPRK